MSATVTTTYIAPNLNRVAAVTYQGRSYIVRRTPKLTTTVWLGSTRITKKDHPAAFHTIAGAAFDEWERMAAEAVIARRVAEVEAIADAAEPAEEPACRNCRYLTGHTTWCPDRPAVEPAPAYTDSGEIRYDEHGARYWTAAEIAELREREAAEQEQAEIDAYLAGAKHVADRRAAEAAEQGTQPLNDPRVPCCGRDAADCDCQPLTPAHLRAAVSSHPAGSAIRLRWLLRG